MTERPEQAVAHRRGEGLPGPCRARDRRRRPVPAGLRRGLVLPLALAACACTNTVVPPARVDEPAAAFLLDHGRHASLVLERGDGVTRYAYGQWAWYAQNRTGPLRASGVLLGGSRAGLGRRDLPGPAEMATVRRQVRVPIVHAWRIDVPAARARALAAELEGIFRAHAATRLVNPLYDLAFVHHPAPYSAWHNSNHVTGQWLRTLGCEVRMGGPFSAWEVERPSATGAARAAVNRSR